MKTIGIAWPEFNEGLTYSDIVSPSNSGFFSLSFYSSHYNAFFCTYLFFAVLSV